MPLCVRARFRDPPLTVQGLGHANCPLAISCLGTPQVLFGSQKEYSRNRKWCRQTGSRQSTPQSTIRTRYGNSVSTPGATRTGKNKQTSLQKGSRYGISVSTPHRRYGHRLRTPFLRTPFPRLLSTENLRKNTVAKHFGAESRLCGHGQWACSW